MRQTEKTKQNMDNLSFDKDYGILSTEIIGTDGTNPIRVAVTSEGYLKVVVV